MSDEKGKEKGGGAKPKGKPVSAGASSGLKVNGSEIIVLLVFLVIFSAVFGFFWSGDANGGPGILSGKVHDSFMHLYVTLNTVSTVVSMVALAVAIYSFMRIVELSTAETKKLGLALNWNSEKKQKNERWSRVETYMTSLNPSDWKIAILEADNILDQIVERMGYAGTTLGERMKQIEASDFPYLEEAWVAHKMRNSIAHKGTDYELSRSDAEQTINIYHRIFRELGYL